MVIASDYPFLDVVGTMLVFFAWVVWIYLLVVIFADLFGRHDIGGWAKAGWTLLVLILPFIGVLAYLGFEGRHMAERKAQQLTAQKSEFDAYVRDVAAAKGSNGPASEIANAKQLLDTGAIDQAEFEQLKSRALAHA
jgi:hypothetical protein